jgi:hypothetical protein
VPSAVLEKAAAKIACPAADLRAVDLSTSAMQEKEVLIVPDWGVGC